MAKYIPPPGDLQARLAPKPYEDGEAPPDLGDTAEYEPADSDQYTEPIEAADAPPPAKDSTVAADVAANQSGGLVGLYQPDEVEMVLQMGKLPTRSEPYNPLPISVNTQQARDIVGLLKTLLALYNSPERLFMRGRSLVAVAGDTPTVVPYTRAMATALAYEVATWTRLSKGQDYPALPPQQVLGIMSDPGCLEDVLPQLTRFTTTPGYGPTGSLLQPGFNACGCTYFAPPKALAEIPIYRSVDTALQLLLQEVLVDFPFATPSDLANAVGLMLLPYLRDLIDGPIPIIGAECHVVGGGKDLLVDSVATMAEGRPANKIPLPATESERLYSLMAILGSVPSFVVLDNIEFLDSSGLAAALTAERLGGRLVRSSTMGVVKNRAIWVTTSNNPGLSQEMSRRYVRVRLQPNMEAPASRPLSCFKHAPLVPWIRENRAALVGACLTLIRAWLQAGRPAGLANMGSFEGFCSVVGGVLQNAGLHGFLDNRNEVKSLADFQTSEWTECFQAWWDTYADNAVSASEVLMIVEQRHLLTSAVYGSNKRALQTRLGRALQKHKDSVFGGYQLLVEVNRKAKAHRYRLIQVPQPAHEDPQPDGEDPPGKAQ